MLTGVLILVIGRGVLGWGQNTAGDLEHNYQQAENSQQAERAARERGDAAAAERARQQGEKAKQGIVAAADRQPDDGGLQYKAAGALDKLGDDRRAKPLAERAVSLAPDAPDPLVLRGNIHYKLGEYRQARSDAKAALRLDGRNAAAVALLRSTEGREGASQYGNDGGGRSGGEESSEGRPKGYAGQSEAQAAADRLRAARLVREAENKERLGEHEAARAAAEKAARLDPGNPAAFVLLGRALIALKDPKGAAEAATKALDLKGDDAEAYALRAAARAALGEFNAAFQDADRAVGLAPEGPAGYIARATARLGAGEAPEAAMKDFDRAAELAPEFRAIYERAARKYRQDAAAGRPSRRKNIFTKTFRLWWVVAAVLAASLLALVRVAYR